MSYPEQIQIEPLTKPPSATVRVPGSKSITNRALVLAAMCCRGYERRLTNVLKSEDTDLMREALITLGFTLVNAPNSESIRVGNAGRSLGDRPIPVDNAELFVGNSGTTMRFLTALVSLGPGRYRLDGVARMRERPIADLLSAVQQLGVEAKCDGNNGCPPVVIRSDGWKGNRVCVKSDLSSQFISGILMAAPFGKQAIHVVVEGQAVSEPYIRMTVEMMRQWGLQVEEISPTEYRIPAPQVPPEQEVEYRIEPDASAASYFWAAAAMTQGRVTVLDIPEPSLQGDVAFVDVLAEMGCRVERCSAGVTVHGRALHGIDVDMNAISDTVMTLAAVACFAEGPTTIRNVAHIRHKETDRLAALATELRRVGAGVEERADGLTITPRLLHGAKIETYHDHRMAMSMALLGLRVPGILIQNPACVAKTYPDFFADWEQLR